MSDERFWHPSFCAVFSTLPVLRLIIDQLAENERRAGAKFGSGY